jgi:putative protease
MKKKFELLAPGGDLDAIKAAIAAGADAIYCGLDHFNARKRAENLVFDDLGRLLRLAHQHDVQIFLTLNIMILEHEIPALLRLLNKLVNTRLDGVIVQDLGLFYLLSQHFKSLDVHASTQVTTHNVGQIDFLHQLGVSRVNLSRELDLDEITELTQAAHAHQMLTEVFVHGSNCIGFSGLCYLSSAYSGNSGNRGRCSQPCRDAYQTTNAGKNYPLNMKDNSAFYDLQAFYDAGVDSLKVEGRIKKSHYVYTVIKAWRAQLERFYNDQPALVDELDRYRVFNRDFTHNYLTGAIGREMFIDNPRDNAVNHFVDRYGYTTEAQIQSVKRELYDAKTAFIETVASATRDMSLAKMPLILKVAGTLGQPLTVQVITPDETFIVTSQSRLKPADNYTINASAIEKRLKSLAGSDYDTVSCDFDALQSDLFVPFKELTTLKNEIAYRLNGSRETIAPVELERLKSCSRVVPRPRLAALIGSEAAIEPCRDSDCDLYYQLPEAMQNQLPQLVALFEREQALIPWFPAIMMGPALAAAATFLKLVAPARIVTNNSGVAHWAYRLGIDWVAGPAFNTGNGYTLECLKTEFKAKGAFISNELSRDQIKRIPRPDDFELHYSIYHPNLLLSSRQCLFLQSIGCKKTQFDAKCLKNCNKSTSIINLNGASYVIDKQKGSHNCLFGRQHVLNTDVLADLPKHFAGYLVDLRDIKTDTQVTQDKRAVLALFHELLEGCEEAKAQLALVISPTLNTQYHTGVQ